MALTPLSLTEQQMQPLARSRKSVTLLPSSWEMGRGFVVLTSGMADVLPNSLRMTAIFLPCRAVRM